HMPLAFVPISFEMGVLAAGLCTFAAVLVLARLVRLWHPVFEADGFTSATDEGYWLEVRADDPRFDRTETAAQLRGTGALRVVLIAIALAGCGGGFERMDDQSRTRCDRDRATPWLPGGACDLPPPDGTVAWHDTPAPPAPLTRALLERGHDRFDRFCAACHGLAGDGRTPVANAMTVR